MLSGVPQGSVFDQILYLIYTAKVPTATVNSLQQKTQISWMTWPFYPLSRDASNHLRTTCRNSSTIFRQISTKSHLKNFVKDSLRVGLFYCVLLVFISSILIFIGHFCGISFHTTVIYILVCILHFYYTLQALGMTFVFV